MAVDPFSWKGIFEALNAREVRYVIVGGLAVVLHGHPRLTGDVDLMVDLAEAPARRAMEALLSLGLRPSVPVDANGFADAAVRQDWIARNMLVLNLHDGTGSRSVDLFIENRVDFEQAWERSIQSNYDGVPVRIASIQDLIEMKRRSGRPQDLLDIERLLELARLRNGETESK